MDGHSGPHRLATYLHPGPGGPFLELNNEPLKPPSPVTSALLQHNPSLLDLCTFNSFCQRYMENNPSSNSVPYKPLVSPSDLYFRLEPISKLEEHSPSTDVITKLNILPDSTNSPISSAGDCSPNVSSYNSTPYSSPKVTRVLQTQSPSNTEHLPKSKSQNRKHKNVRNIEESRLKKKNNISSLKQSKFSSETAPTENSLISLNVLLSEKDSNEILQDHSETADRDRSPEYVSRYSPYYISKNPTETSYRTRAEAKNCKLNRRESGSRDDQNSTICQKNVPENKISILSENCRSLVEPETSNFDEASLNSSPSNKRTIETSQTDEFKQKKLRSILKSKIIVQQGYCVSYPENIPRCIDCQTSSPADISLHLAGCRFQNCRRLKHFEDDIFEVDGFTKTADCDTEEVEALRTPNNCNQPALNFVDANYIFTRISKFFCLMFLQEQNERSKNDETAIVWKRYMPGWREVCDECSTTLFNQHYICRECGFMICIECSDQFSQLPIEKRRKMKRLCEHENSFLLSEFIPWKILLTVRNEGSNYLSRRKLDYTMKLYPPSKNENLSAFIRSLKMRRNNENREVQKSWSSNDCNNDPNIEFFCDGRLPVFNEWTSQNSKEFFRKVWSNSSPVLVRNVHRDLSETLWQPLSFKEHMIDHRETPALWDCETLTPIQTDRTILNQFWDGFECLDVRLRDEENGGRTRILKLKDWPTKKDFAAVFPSRLHDLMKNIPFADYTRRSYTFDGVDYQAGTLNIVERLPNYLVRPDLGPKLYIAYSQLTSQATKKAGTTNLHIDVSDAVNVLVYVGVGGHGENGIDKNEEIQQVEAEIRDVNIDEVQLQRLRNGERPGALWHLFRSDDAKKIREYIGRTQRRAPGSDTIHDQSAYLEKEDLIKLREWSKVENFPILQFLGDAVFIPSGAPHQVKNLHSCIKIAEDFVSPENIDRCLITANEFRSLSKSHTNHADILQAKNILYYTTRDALNSLIEPKSDEKSTSSDSTVNN